MYLPPSSPLIPTGIPGTLPLPDKSPKADKQPADAAGQGLKTGESLALSEPRQSEMPEPLQFEQAATAAQGKGPAKPVKPPVKRDKPEPAVKPPEPVKAPEPPKEDPDAGIEKPPRLSGSKRLAEKDDDTLYEMYLSLQREVRDDLKASGTTLPDAEKKDMLVEKLLLRMGQESFAQLPDAQKTAIRGFVNQFEFKDLVLAEVQSEGGADAVEGIVTGTGVDGHYTSSMLHSLQGLMASRRLTPELLGALNQLYQAPLQADLAPLRMTLLRSTLQELAFPERIEQHSKGTCAPTTVQIVLALRDPVKYAQIVASLAGPDGKVPAGTLGGNAGMERETDTIKDDRSGRSLSSRLIQPAFMEYGNGPHIYDNAKDRNSDGKTEYSGLDEHGSIRLLDALFGKGAYSLRFVHPNPEPYWEGFVKPEVLMNELDKALTHGAPVPVGLRWGESGHKVLLTRLDKSENLAYLMNPWGELQTMPLETFKRRVDSASMPKAQATEQPAQATLPGRSSQTASYEPIHNWRYYKVTDYLLEDPVLKNLSDDRKSMLREKFRTLKLSGDYASQQMDVLAKLAKLGLADNKLFDRIAAVRDKDELAGVVKLYATVDKLPLDKFKTLVAAEPDKNLDTIWYAMLMDDVAKPEVFETILAKAQARQAAVADGSAQAAEQAQAGLKDDFVALAPGDLKGLKPLLDKADEASKAFMLRKVIDNWPPGKAEEATDLITADLKGKQLNYLQQVLDPSQRVIGPDDAMRYYLRNTLVRVAVRQRAATAHE